MNVVLIGMPASGKSTLGVLLAKTLGFDFLDSDLLIQKREKALLSKIIEEKGVEEFNRIEEEVNACIQVENTVIATGGSVVYGARAMEHFKKIGLIVYLKLPFETIEERLGDIKGRGVSIRDGETLFSLFLERVPLYEKYADITLDLQGKTIEESVRALAKEVNK